MSETFRVVMVIAVVAWALIGPSPRPQSAAPDALFAPPAPTGYLLDYFWLPTAAHGWRYSWRHGWLAY